MCQDEDKIRQERVPNYPAGGNNEVNVSFAFWRDWSGVPRPGC